MANAAHTTRRALFGAVAVFPLVAVPEITQAMPPGPMMALLAERNRGADWLNAEPCWGEQREGDRLEAHQQLWRTEDEILASEPATLDALRAQMGLLLKINEEGAELDYELIVQMARGGFKLLDSN